MIIFQDNKFVVTSKGCFSAHLNAPSMDQYCVPGRILMTSLYLVAQEGDRPKAYGRKKYHHRD